MSCRVAKFSAVMSHLEALQSYAARLFFRNSQERKARRCHVAQRSFLLACHIWKLTAIMSRSEASCYHIAYGSFLLSCRVTKFNAVMSQRIKLYFVVSQLKLYVAGDYENRRIELQTPNNPNAERGGERSEPPRGATYTRREIAVCILCYIGIDACAVTPQEPKNRVSSSQQSLKTTGQL